MQVKAKRLLDATTSFPVQNSSLQRVENSVISVGNTFQPQMIEIDDLIDEDMLFAIDDLKKTELPLDKSYLLKERIRERNRLYQRRRRARMTEEQRKREKERRRQYMQSRRVQHNSYEMSQPQPIGYEKSEECEQSPQYGQQLWESEGSILGQNPSIGEVGEAS